MATTWSLRQACDTAGVTRATGRALAADEIIPAGELGPADLVVLRAAATCRSLLYTGERQPANAAREVRPRERKLAASVRAAVGEGLAREATLLLFQDDAVVCGESGSLITAVLAAQSSGRQYLVLPVGAWAAELLGTPVAAMEGGRNATLT